MRLIHARIAESSNAADQALYARAKADQLLDIWALVPLLFLFNLACTFAICSRPDFFIARAGHVWLIGAQLVSFIGYLFYVARFFRVIAPLVLRSRQAD
jgi:hypothetical protein